MIYGKIQRIEPQKIDGRECRYSLTIRSPKLNGNFLLAKLLSNNPGASRNAPIYEIVEKQGEFLCPWGLVFRNDTKQDAKCVVLGLSLDHPDWEKPFNLAAFSTSERANPLDKADLTASNSFSLAISCSNRIGLRLESEEGRFTELLLSLVICASSSLISVI